MPTVQQAYLSRIGPRSWSWFRWQLLRETADPLAYSTFITRAATAPRRKPTSPTGGARTAT